MFEKYNPEARRAVVLAQEAARELNHTFINPEHLLIALTRDEGMAGEALDSLYFDTTELQDLTTRLLGRGTTAPAGNIPFTKQSRAVLERAHELHFKLSHQKVGPEHILMALTTLDDAIPSEVYAFFDTTEAQLQEAVARSMVTGAAPSGPTGPFTFYVQVDPYGTIHRDLAASTSRKAKFTLHPGELFSVCHDGAIDENARFLDYEAARDDAAEFYGDVVILTSRQKDIDAVDRSGDRIKVGEVTVWTPEPIVNRLVFLD
jgi:ATP-dependent Clp protease ATP-binding subunit ClpA